MIITREQAKRFVLSKQGLLGKYRFTGKEGAYQYVRQAGCIQYDPVDVCGKNAELTLLARVKGFTKSDLSDLLYKDRLLVDYSDKELPIVYGQNLIGRIEAVSERRTGTLTVRNIWYESGIKETKKLAHALGMSVKRLARFNGCSQVTAP